VTLTAGESCPTESSGFSLFPVGESVADAYERKELILLLLSEGELQYPAKDKRLTEARGVGGEMRRIGLEGEYSVTDDPLDGE
jgi:hypothetical protein